ncbi:TPA: SmdB family multidrug efflux ABC transporter permease/ATP-binding protein [Escherichia coli]|nr:SmdB family multidrug efflux ABC transporter permease/ATP-binding protein [Escherichia coli]
MRLFAQLSWYFRREWRRYLGAVALLVIIAMLQLVPPKVVGIVVDGVTEQHFTTGQILMWIATMVLIAVVVYLLRYVWRVLLFGASYQLAVELREDYYRQLSRQHPEFYLRHRTGDLMARATNDVDRVVFAAGEGVLTLVDSLVMGCAVLIMMSTQISWQLTLFALLPMPVMAIMIKRNGDALHERFKLAQAAFSSLNDRTQESLTSIRMIKAFGLEDRQSALFAADAEDTGKKNMRVARIDARFDPTIYIAIGMANLLAIGGGSWMVVQGSLTLGQLTSFMMYLGLMIWPMLALAWMFNIVERGSTPIVRRVRAYLADINDGFNEIINGMSVIQQFRQQARFGERMGEASRSHYMARMQTLRLDGFLLRPLLSLFSSLILCGLLMLFGFSASGTIEVGVLYAFISYLGRLNEPLIELTTQQAMLQQAVVAGERVFELMDGPRQQYGNDDRSLQSGTIDVDNVSFAYRDDNLVLKNINLSVPSRNFVALVGHTGSGKSTLASLLMGYYPLTEGEIRLDGRPLSTLSHSALRQGVAMVQQDPVVLADTFLANVTLGRDISEERVWQALETVQLAELARSMSDGIYTLLGEQGNNLSVGQKQLLALARVLVETPQILILDEATASIDSGTEQAIQHALAAVREHTTLVVIAHRLSTIVDADTILVLHRGQAVEQGTHQQLLAAQGRYWQMYQLQLAGEELAASVREEESLSA